MHLYPSAGIYVAQWMEGGGTLGHGKHAQPKRVGCRVGSGRVTILHLPTVGPTVWDLLLKHSGVLTRAKNICIDMQN